MSRIIRFFLLSTGETAPDLDYFVRGDGSVWRDNYRTYESQCSVVGFDDFVMPCENVGWEVVETATPWEAGNA